MLNARIRKHWDRFMRPVGRAVGRSGISPDAVTVFGVALQVLAALYIIQGRLLVAGLVTILAGIADVLDGAIAKAQGRASAWGALFDSTTDRLADALVFGSLAWLYSDTWVGALAIATMVASFLVSYVKARAESLGLECNVGIAERAERIIIVVLGLVFDVVPAMLVLLGVLSLVTFLQRLAHVWRREPRGA